MKPNGKLSFNRTSLAAGCCLIVILSASTAHAAAEQDATRAVNVIRGEVIDKSSGLPIDNAQIVLIYTAPRKMSVRGVDCVRSANARTNALGKFDLQVERKFEDIPANVIAVAPDYFAAGRSFAGEMRFLLTRRTDPNIELKDQSASEALSNQRFYLLDSHLDCWRAKSREDAAGAASALQILKESYTKYDTAGPRGMRNNVPQEISRQIFLLESLPIDGASAR